MLLQRWWLLGALVIPVAFSPRSDAGNLPADSPLKCVLSAIKNRESQANPIWVRYHVDYHESARWVHLSNPRDPPVERRYSCVYDYARKGDKFRSVMKPADPSMRSWLGEYFTIFTGEISIWLNSEKDGFVISRSPRYDHFGELPTEIAGQPLLLEYLGDVDDGRVTLLGKPSVKEETVGGQWQVRMRWTAKSRASASLLALPSQDWVWPEWTDYYPNGKPGRKHVTEQYETRGGFYYPVRGNRVEYFEDDGALIRSLEFQVDALETQEAKIPDDLFRYQFPKGAQIWDEDNKIMVRDTELTESHLADIIRRASPRRHVLRSWCAAALVLLDCAAAFVVARQWRRRRAVPVKP